MARPGFLGRIAKACKGNIDEARTTAQKEALIAQLHAIDADEVEVDGRKVNKAALIAAIAGAGLLLPRTAFAGWMDDLANKLMSGITSAIKPIFDTFGKVLAGDFGAIFDKTSEKVTIAIGGMTDVLGTVITDAENNRVKQDTKPAPDECASDLIGKESTQAQNRATVHAVQESVSVSNRIMTSSAGAGRATLQQIQGRYGEIPKESINPTLALSKHNIVDKAELDKLRESKNIMAGDTAYVGSQELIKTTLNQYGERAGLDAQARVMAKNLRLQVCLDPQIQMLAARDGTQGESKMSLLQKEIERTYGSDEDGWRKEINLAASSVPLLKDLAKQISLQNKLMLEQLMLSERQGLLTSVSILEKMDQNRTDNLRHEAV
ncbi:MULTISPECIES: hypothetical protein [Aeromonas]|uniref:Uncharacterized protein n=1 Tax=Aeromonas veronii TaxID=654 RepID=A0A4S5CGW5_AERVE|nr:MULTISPECIES: hypothetical protein [Aeromonas]THJ43693.1 hypothetical protein E8Q35_15425 [Aeromonas veronii]